METSEKPEWCYLDMHGQHQGPFPLSYLQGLNQSGYFNPEAMFWKEGLPEWKPLKDLPELAELLSHAPPEAAGERDDEENGAAEPRLQLTKAAAVQSAASAAAEMAAASGGATAALKKTSGAVLASSAQVVPASAAATAGGGGATSAVAEGKGTPPDAELAGFLAEISALEGAAGEAAEDAAPASPPPDERTFVDDDGTLYVWDPSLRKFMPSEQPAGYTEDDMVFVADQEQQPEYQPPRQGEEEEEDEEMDRPLEGEGGQPNKPAAAAAKGAGGTDAAVEGSNGEGDGNGGGKRTRQQEAAMDAARERIKKARAARQQQEGWFELKVNTSVYVTGLPEDVTEQEIVETFSKCGIIKEDDQHRPRVKIYRSRESGLPKGDGLVTFLKEPSVGLAIQILDGAPLRYGLKPMSVSLAKFEQKGEQYMNKQDVGKKRAKKKVLQKLEKDLGWAGFDDVLKPQQVTVVLKHMFHPDELLADPSYKSELEADITSECAKLGVVDKVRVFQNNPEGVVSVKFKTEEGADGCIRVMNGRFFAGRQLEAIKWDGVTNYNVKVKESEEQQLARLEKFAKELEEQGGEAADAQMLR